MPQLLLSVAALSASAFGGGSLVTQGLVGLWGISTTAIGGALLNIGLSVGLSYLSTALQRQDAPRPEDVQNQIKNSTAPRVRHYGRVKASGVWVFAESKSGNLHKVLALGTGELDAIEEYWVDGNLVALDGGGFVAQEPYEGNLRILARRGLPTETHYAELASEFSEWTVAHRGDGVSSLYAYQDETPPEKISERFPNLVNTLYRVVVRGAKIFNPITGTIEWTDNAAAVIRDYLIHEDGTRLPSSLVTTPQAITGWLNAATRANASVPLKAGGVEPAYRLWGSYSLNERPGDVIGRMLASCDGMLLPTPDGGVALDIGSWIEPTVVIDQDAIVGITEFQRGRDIMATANKITSTYLSPIHDYQSTDADPWIDDVDAAARGEIAIDRPYAMAPSHSQCRRLMKLAAYRANPRWIGTFQCNLRALTALAKRFVRIRYPLFGIDEVFEVLDLKFEIGPESVLQGVTLQVQSMPQEAYQWNPATEEGTAPIAETTTVDRTIPTPIDLTFTEAIESAGGQNYSVGVITFGSVPSLSLRVEARYKAVSSSQWISLPIDNGATGTRTGILADGVQYEAQVRHISSTGREGGWTTSEYLTPLSNPTAPLALSSVAAAAGPYLGNVQFNLVTQYDSNLAAINVYRVPNGVTLDKNTHAKIVIPALPGSSFGYVYGDGTRTNILSNGGFDSDTVWAKGTGWSIGSGTATKSSGTASPIHQVAPYVNGDTVRTSFELSGVSGGSIRVTASGATSGFVQGGVRSANGTYIDTLAIAGLVGANNRLGYSADSAFDGSVDNAIAYLATSGCAPQGAWDFYAFPVNPSGVEGPGAAAIINVVII